MKIDNFYFIVEDLDKSIKFYSELFEEEPVNVTENRWADWCYDNKQIYFGIISRDVTGDKLIRGNNGVLGLRTNNIEDALDKCKKMGVKILYYPECIPNSLDNYVCFAIEDLDGNKIEIAYYDK